MWSSSSTSSFLRFMGGQVFLFRDALRSLRTHAFPWAITIEQVLHIGIKSLPLVMITALSTGMVMSLQFGLGLEKFGGKLYVPKIVSLTILREMGPVFTSLMIAARVGAGMASEIGSMVVTQQVDAMRALGTSPIQKIVVPRLVACLFVLPILVAIANFISNTGGAIVGATELNLDFNFYVLKVLQTVDLADYLSGFMKSFFFSLFITIPACYLGLTVANGTQEVGAVTTKAVVSASIFILVGDYFLSKAFWIIEKML